MVLFLFVIMLLNAGAESPSAKSSLAKWLGIPLLVVFLGLVSFLVRHILPDARPVTFGGFTGGTAKDVGIALFTRYLLPFEVTSVLVLIAIAGAIVLARKEMD